MDYILTCQNIVRYQFKIKREIYILKMVILIGLSHIYLLNTYTMPNVIEHQWWVTDSPFAEGFWSEMG